MSSGQSIKMPDNNRAVNYLFLDEVEDGIMSNNTTIANHSLVNNANGYTVPTNIFSDHNTIIGKNSMRATIPIIAITLTKPESIFISFLMYE